MKQAGDLLAAQTLALAIVDTLPEPFVVLDDQLRVVAASRCYYEFFSTDAEHTRGQPFFELGDGQWDIPALRQLIETIIPEHTAMDGFEVDHEFRHLGHRVLLLNARVVRVEDRSSPTILLAFKDITQRRAVEQEKQDLLDHTKLLLAQQRTLLREMEHRIANSLQIIASILLLKAGKVTSEETRVELRDAHKRVISVAEVQRHLHGVDGIEQIDIAAYLTKLAAGLATSMTGPQHAIAIEVVADEGTVPTAQAVSMGLIVTELVINAIKYAFPDARTGNRVLITYQVDGTDWMLAVSDNGVGATKKAPSSSGGLGTAIVGALSKQLMAGIKEVSSASGFRMEIAHTTFKSHLPMAA